MYKKIDSSRSFVQMEREILDSWNKNDIVDKSFALNEEGEYFTFL